MQTQSISQNILAIQPQAASKASKAVETGFGQIMSKNTGSSEEGAESRFTAESPEKSRKVEVKETAPSREEFSKNRVSLKNEQKTVSDAVDPEPDAVEAKIVETLEDIFGMSAEDIIDILEQLGLVPMDLALMVVNNTAAPDVRLVNVDNIKAFIMEMHGVDDAGLFLVSDQMSGELTDVMNGIEDLFAQEFGMDTGQLTQQEQQLLRDFAAAMEQTPVSEEDVPDPVVQNPEAEVDVKAETNAKTEQPVPVNTEQPVAAEEVQPDRVSEQPEAKMPEKAATPVNMKEQDSVQRRVDDEGTKTVSEFVNGMDSNVGRDAAKQSTNVSAEDTKAAATGTVNDIPVVVEVSEESGSSNDAFQNSGEKLSDHMMANEGPVREHESPILSFVERLSESFEAVREGDSVAARPVTMEYIVEQVVNHVRIRVLPQTTSMELQLNPASLGRVNLNVTSQNGTATATLTVQNQVAKEALESQLTVLRENLESQGLKVDAVEVNVSEFGFKHPEDSNSSQSRQNRKSSQSRRFRFDSVEETEETEATAATTADRRDGSSVVDYTA